MFDERIRTREARLGIVGLGYAGLPLAILFADAGFNVTGIDLNDTREVPLWPGDSPNVISVGGTLLSVRQDGTYLQEAGWEDILSQGGTGGGVNGRLIESGSRPSFSRSRNLRVAASRPARIPACLAEPSGTAASEPARAASSLDF